MKVTISPSQAYCLPFSSTVDVTITLPATEMKSIHLQANHGVVGTSQFVDTSVPYTHVYILNKVEDTSQNLPQKWSAYSSKRQLLMEQSLMVCAESVGVYYNV